MSTLLMERHYTVHELATAWGLSDTTVRRMFQDSPEVLKIGKSHRRNKRGYVTLRIPESVAKRAHGGLV